ncbi:MAG: hypothetical protein U0556_03705 [Dehalococcoidia bacterium]
MLSRWSFTIALLAAAVFVGGLLAIPDATAQEPNAGCRELDSQAVTGRRALHTPYPCSRFDAPTANSVLTGTATSLVRGKSSANCEPNRLGVPTRVDDVAVQLGAGAAWQAITFSPYDTGCFANWNVTWALPRADHLEVVLSARTTTFHGLPTIFTLYPEDPPTSITVRVDNIGPTVLLSAPPLVVGDRFAVVWSARDGAGIQTSQLEYNSGSGWTAWRSEPAGTAWSAGVGPSTPVVVQPGGSFRFRARATDKNGLTSEWVEAGPVEILGPGQRSFVPLSALTRQP